MPGQPPSSASSAAASAPDGQAAAPDPASAADLFGTERYFTAQRRMLSWLLAGTVLLPAVLLTAWAWLSLDALLRDAGQHSVRLARVVQEHASKVFETNHQVNSRVRDAFAGMSNAQLRQREADMHARLREIGNGMPQASSLSVFDADGVLLASSRFYPVSRVSIADREDFVAIVRERRPFHVSRVMAGRVMGDPIFNFSLPRLDPGGALTGIVAVSLRPAYFSGFYQDLLSEDPAFSAALVLRDGSVLAAYPARPGAEDETVREALARQFASETSGAVDAPGLDGRDALLAYRAVGSGALQAVVSVPRAAILARWRERLYIATGVLAVPSLALWGLIGMSLHRLRRERAAWRRWQDEAARRREAEDNYRQARKLEVIGRLIASVAHDFRNVLSVISFNADVLALNHGRGSGRGAGADAGGAAGHPGGPGGSGDAGADPFSLRVERAREQALQGIRKGVATGTALSGQLLGMARKREHRKEWIHLAHQLDGWTPLIQATLGSRIRLRYRIDARCGSICVDRGELELALVNLAANARDAMPQGGLFEISAGNAVLAEPHTAPGLPAAHGAVPGYVCIAARDTGVGMSDAVRQRAFEPLYTTKEPGLGTGLGLSQVLEFCRESNGAAAIESSPGKGTTVRMFLPARDAAVDAVQTRAAVGGLASRHATPGADPRHAQPGAGSAGSGAANAAGAGGATGASGRSQGAPPGAVPGAAPGAGRALLVPLASPTAPPVKESERHDARDAPAGPPLSILLVAGDLQSIQASAKSLAGAGHRVKLADSEASALLLVDGTGFDLVLADARLGGPQRQGAAAPEHGAREGTPASGEAPLAVLGAAAGFGGLALLRRLAWRYPFLPVVLMTEEADVLTLATLTGRRFLVKPWHAQTLRRAGVLALAMTAPATSTGAA